MKIGIRHKSRGGFLPVMAIAAMTLLTGSCSGRQKSDMSDTANVSEAPDAETMKNIDTVCQSIIKGDRETFARKVSYPVERPYPLRDIKDEKEMERYFDVMVDDSLKSVVKRNKAEKWESAGWEGWVMHEGRYILFDGQRIYAVEYVSPRERVLIDSLRRDEIQSLDKEMRHGWIPVKVLEATGDGTLFRIDRDSLDGEDASEITVRLAVYPPRSDYHKRPQRLMKGKAHAEGTIGGRVYEFHDTAGNRAEYTDVQTSSEEPLDIIVITTRGDTIVSPVIPTYWRDHTKISAE